LRDQRVPPIVGRSAPKLLRRSEATVKLQTRVLKARSFVGGIKLELHKLTLVS